MNDSGSLNVVARAGCGKTTMLLNVVETIVEHDLGRVFLGAYNKAIASEIQEKLRQRGVPGGNVEASTMHSMGFKLWRMAAPRVKVDEKKMFGILDPFAMQERIVRENLDVIRRTVSLAKQSGFGFLHGIEDPSAWYDLMDHHGIDDFAEGDIIDDIVQCCMIALRKSNETIKEIIDFDDMLLAPLIGNVLVRYPYDWVLIDEAQDTNATRRALALKVLKPKTGRLIAVGDDRQAIYGFTGADSNAMTLIADQLGSSSLPLNVTYRCPKAVVAEAQKYVPDITAHESAPDGKVTRKVLVAKAQNETQFEASGFKASDVILCRNTAPIIQLAYELIGKRIGCHVEGRDIGSGLKKLAQKWKIKTLQTLSKKIEDYVERERAKWLSKGREEKAAVVEDRVQSLLALIDLCQSEGKQDITDLCELIDSMFADTPAGQRPKVLTLSTIHKSKGREWDRVFILDAEKYMPSKYARKDWQKHQEANLAYVAITRAKNELVYLSQA